jgi:hypothetical protein
MDELKAANLVLYVAMPSTTLEVVDHENLALTRALDYFLYAILLQGVPTYMKGFSLSGANIGGEVDVRQFSELKDYQPTYEMPNFRVGETELRQAVAISERLRRIDQARGKWGRLRRGLTALLRGTTFSDGGDRLHQFVRALEALTKPEIGNTRNLFAHRIDQTFTLANADARETLLQIFDLRSHVEHMHLAIDALPGDEESRIAIANRRTRQMDVLARFALRQLIQSDHLLEAFRTDANIDAFWQLGDAERVRQWGARLDLVAIR